MQSPRTDTPPPHTHTRLSHLTFLHPVLEVPRYSTVSRASKDHHTLPQREMASSRDESRSRSKGEECRKKLFNLSLTSLQSFELL